MVTEAATIDFLCANEQVLTLAQDIADNGLSPLENFGVIRKEDGRYFMAEGNRRLCALKLLNQPALAPDNLKQKFTKAAKGWKPVQAISATVFDDRDDASLWLARIHQGVDEGRGRRPWDAVQKARHSSSSRNDLAILILDWAEQEGLITSDQRGGRMSTVNRYVGNPILRETLGIEKDASGQYLSFFSEDAFLLVMRAFLDDVVEKRINTRAKSDEIKEYARELRAMPGYSEQRFEGRPLIDTKDEVNEGAEDESAGSTAQGGTEDEGQEPAGPVRPPKERKRIGLNKELKCELEKLDSRKLASIYYSLCRVEAKHHTPLLTVGAWSLLESLTAYAGRKKGNAFDSYLSSGKIQHFGFDKSSAKDMAQIIRRISENGNATKHSSHAANFNHEQLIADFLVIEDLLLCLVREAIQKANES